MQFGQLIVEIDGAYWHASKTAFDSEKTAVLEDLGFHVIRVREIPLEAISSQDIVVNSLSDTHTAACAVLCAIQTQLNFGAPGKEAVSRYIRAGKLQADEEAREMIAAFLQRDYGERSLAATHPAIADDWDEVNNHPFTPEMFTPGSGFKASWICTQGHRFVMMIAKRTGRSGKCPYCSGRRVGYGNDLASLHPNLANEWHATNEKSPSEVTPGSMYKAAWICDAGHVWSTQVKNRVNGSGCQKCYWGWM
ncbi:zinc-ribbon domain-containing protein [Streptosporangium canum]|uniref:zinc-ribbon domain-containing protein n=1 Tax=Streptosporangium canum TaxID=324952 RepID=UPI00379C3F62